MKIESITIVAKLDNGNIHNLPLSKKEQSMILELLTQLNGKINLLSGVLDNIEIKNLTQNNIPKKGTKN